MCTNDLFRHSIRCHQASPIGTKPAHAKRHSSVNIDVVHPRRSLLIPIVLIGAMSACRSTSDVREEQPFAIWSSTDSTVRTPEAAADAAVRDLLGVEPVVGEFMAGDSRSGEVVVFSPGESVPVERSLLLMRQLGPDDRWSVIGAINEAMTIAVPATMSIHPSGPLRVSGRARGFEALVIVSAHRVGDDTELIDDEVIMGGSLERSEPYDVVLDLSDTEPGDIVAIVVRGGVGLEDDPGEFSAIPIRIGP